LLNIFILKPRSFFNICEEKFKYSISDGQAFGEFPNPFQKPLPIPAMTVRTIVIARSEATLSFLSLRGAKRRSNLFEIAANPKSGVVARNDEEM